MNLDDVFGQRWFMYGLIILTLAAGYYMAVQVQSGEFGAFPFSSATPPTSTTTTNTIPLPRCDPECRFVETASEGWYDPCLQELIKYGQCSACISVCMNIDTQNEGWYSSCDDGLIKLVQCSR